MTFPRMITGLLGILLLIVAVQAFLPDTYVPQPAPKPPVGQTCLGDPIKVDYPFAGGFLEPWACQIQCTDGKQRYVLYSNGQATQCETPPGCNDYGEDNGVTCEPPTTK